MTSRISIEELISARERIPVADVRSPAEFAQGHVPGAFNIPLFTNEERGRVGTTYKQEGREAAILLGFDLTGGKWSGFVRQALDIAPEKKIAVHCWRGGMRSAALAWALDLYGFHVQLVQGGYKSYRRWALRQMEQPYRLFVVGGMTGSGKTRALQELERTGEQIVDLEQLAQHQGSAYGTMNNLIQPTQEQFENELAARLQGMDGQRRVWIEDESRSIGKCLLPASFWEQIGRAPVFDLQVPTERRVDALVGEYGVLEVGWLIECTERICKRLGTEHTRNAIAAIREGRMAEFIRTVLNYYDKMYRKGLDKRDADKIIAVPAGSTDAGANARLLMKAAQGIGLGPRDEMRTDIEARPGAVKA